MTGVAPWLNFTPTTAMDYLEALRNAESIRRAATAAGMIPEKVLKQKRPARAPTNLEPSTIEDRDRAVGWAIKHQKFLHTTAIKFGLSSKTLYTHWKKHGARLEKKFKGRPAYRYTGHPTVEEKEQAIRLAIEEGINLHQASLRLGVKATSVYTYWYANQDRFAGSPPMKKYNKEATK